MVVGLGFVSQFWLPTLLTRADVEVVAVVDPAADRPGPPCPRFEQLDDALDAVEANLVVNLTPPALHREVVEAALERGCHVFGEKPMATTLEDARALVELAEQRGLTFAVMQNRRFVPAVRRLGEAVASGAIGEPVLSCADMFMAPRHRASYLSGMDSPLLREMAIHTFDQARFLAGAEPVAVTCVELDPPHSWYEGAATAIATFELADGSMFSYRGSWVAPGFATSYDAAWRISGTRGTATWDGVGDPEVEVALERTEPYGEAPVERHVWPVEATATGFEACIDAVLDALRDGRPPETDCADTIRSLTMVFAALRSSREQRRVLMNEFL